MERHLEANLAVREDDILGGQGNVPSLHGGACGDWTVPCGESLPNFYQSLEWEGCLHTDLVQKHSTRGQILLSSSWVGGYGGGSVNFWR